MEISLNDLGNIGEFVGALAVVLSLRVNRHDIGMIQAGGRFSLREETLRPTFVVRYETG